MPRENVDNQVQNLLKKALPLIDSSKDRETFTELVKEYTRNYNVRLLVEGLNNIINCPVRFDLYDDVRSIILPQQQMEYNLRTPYVTHRPRVVRLSRKEGTSFGFAVRGGKEHGTGIYVSAVEPDSEADRQGLRVGDQLLRINGLSVEKAIHREVSSIIKSRATLALKVKSAGMIPIRESERTRSLVEIISLKDAAMGVKKKRLPRSVSEVAMRPILTDEQAAQSKRPLSAIEERPVNAITLSPDEEIKRSNSLYF